MVLAGKSVEGEMKFVPYAIDLLVDAVPISNRVELGQKRFTRMRTEGIRQKLMERDSLLEVAFKISRKWNETT